jgi:hypothetical protein
LRADWRLSDGTFVEYAGLLADSGYRDRLVTKIERAAVAGIPVLVLSPNDLVRLDRRLSRFGPAGTPADNPPLSAARLRSGAPQRTRVEPTTGGTRTSDRGRGSGRKACSLFPVPQPQGRRRHRRE